MSLIGAPHLGLPMVYLVDDEDIVRKSISWLLRSRRLLSEDFPSGEAFISFIDAMPDLDLKQWPRSPSCLLLDLRLDGMSGIALFDQLAARELIAEMPVIFLTGHGDVPTAVATVKQGAFDFVEKPFSDNALVDRIESALAMSAEAIAARDARVERRRSLSHLTERERAILYLVTQGLVNKQIAERLDLSVRTVEAHRANVFEKLGVSSAVELTNLLNRMENGTE